MISEYSYEMLKNVSFHQGLHCLLKIKRSSETEIYHLKILIQMYIYCWMIQSILLCSPRESMIIYCGNSVPQELIIVADLYVFSSNSCKSCLCDFSHQLRTAWLNKNLQYKEADDIFWSYGPLINLVFINPVNLICVDSQQLLVGFHWILSGTFRLDFIEFSVEHSVSRVTEVIFSSILCINQRVMTFW